VGLLHQDSYVHPPSCRVLGAYFTATSHIMAPCLKTREAAQPTSTDECYIWAFLPTVESRLKVVGK